MEIQIPLKPFSYCFYDLTDRENDFVRYFNGVNLHNIKPVIERYYPGVGPKGYGSSLILSRILKVKEIFISDRNLAEKLRKNELYRIVCRLKKSDIPAHNTYNTLRNKLGIWGFIEIHTNFVEEAHSLGLLEPDIPQLPQNRRKGIILIADSTMVRAYSSTKAKKLPDGTWLFKDPSLAFGRPHHKYKYPVGHKAHSLINITGIPVVSLVAANNIHDQYYIIPLLDEFRRRYPQFKVAFLSSTKAMIMRLSTGSSMNPMALSRLSLEKRWFIPKDLPKRVSPSVSLVIL